MALGLFLVFVPVLSADDSDNLSCDLAGPQSPRDIDALYGSNGVTFSLAPPTSTMRLCNIHFHRFAEHRSAGYSTYRKKGRYSGFECKKAPNPQVGDARQVGAEGCTHTALGDTVEVHWVFTTCNIKPGQIGPDAKGHPPELRPCLTNSANPQLRVEGRVFYLAEEDSALDFAEFSDVDLLRIPPAPGAVEYLGSTTGDGFNNKDNCSPLQVSWNVGPTCSALSKKSLDHWCKGNIFKETGAHGVRPLVKQPELLSGIN